MGRPGLVEVQAGPEGPLCQLLGDQMVEHEHVGLLDQLGAAHPSGAEEHVGRNRWGPDLRHQERLQVEVAGELLVEPGSSVPPVDQVLGQGLPLRRLVGVAGLREEGGSLAEVPSGHHIGVGVVVDTLVVLVRADHGADVATTVGVGLDAAGPVAGGLDQERTSCSAEEAGIARPGRVVGGRPGHVGHDVLLVRARGDDEGCAVRTDDLVRRDVGSVAPRLPREPGGQQAGGQRFRTGSGQTPEAVLDHGPRRGRPDRDQGGQHENVRIPKDMPGVGSSGQSPGADRGLAAVRCGGQQVEHGIAGGQLRSWVPIDHHLGIRPPRGPCFPVLGEQGVETQGLHLRQSLVRLVQSGAVGGVCGPGGEAFHDPVAARRHLPVPCGHGDPGIPLSGECPGSVATLFGHECPCVGRGAQGVARKELGLGTLNPQCHGLW